MQIIDKDCSLRLRVNPAYYNNEYICIISLCCGNMSVEMSLKQEHIQILHKAAGNYLPLPLNDFNSESESVIAPDRTEELRKELKQDIVKLETRFMQEPTLNLADVYMQIRDLKNQITALHSKIDSVKNADIREKLIEALQGDDY